MKRVAVVLCLAMLAMASAVSADHHEGGSVYGATLAANFEFVSGQLMQLAEAMPEEVYSWRPAEGVRSTSEVFMHVVSANMLMPPAFGVAPADGFEMPENPFAMAREWEETVTSKADVMAKMKESQGTAEQMALMQQRMELMETQLGAMESEMHRLKEVAEFTAQLKAPKA